MHNWQPTPLALYNTVYIDTSRRYKYPNSNEMNKRRRRTNSHTLLIFGEVLSLLSVQSLPPTSHTIFSIYGYICMLDYYPYSERMKKYFFPQERYDRFFLLRLVYNTIFKTSIASSSYPSSRTQEGSKGET